MTRADLTGILAIILGVTILFAGFIILATHLRSIDAAACAVRGLKTIPIPGRSVRLLCIDDQRRLILP